MELTVDVPVAAFYCSDRASYYSTTRDRLSEKKKFLRVILGLARVDGDRLHLL